MITVLGEVSFDHVFGYFAACKFITSHYFHKGFYFSYRLTLIKTFLSSDFNVQ